MLDFCLATPLADGEPAANPAIELDEAMRLIPSLIVITLLVIVALAVATWRLRTMNLE